MEILAAPRGTGKTTKLVTELLDNSASVIVVSTTQRKQSVRPIVELVMRRRHLLDIERDDQHRINAPTPAQRIDEVMERIITCSEVVKQQRRLHSDVFRQRRWLIDDLEDVLYFFIGADITLATVSVR